MAMHMGESRLGAPMPGTRKVLAVVLAGGEGSRLKPLTDGRCKPAVAFHARHRIVDFVLSNLANSALESIWLLVQYEPRQLVDHVARAWPSAAGRPAIRIVAAPAQRGAGSFLGTADAVFRNIRRIEAEQPDLVAVFSADHIYRMDVRQMLAFHCAHGADATVATMPVRLRECSRFGIAQVDTGGRIRRFEEKPSTTLPLPGSTTHALASMGNYVFDAAALAGQLRRMHDAGGTDFGQHLLPAMLETHKVMAYDFTSNIVPGVGSAEERAYWRDVGTLDAWFEAQFDAVGLDPRFQLANPQWPIHTAPDPAAPASVAEGAFIERAILRPGVQVERGARVEDCIVMEGSRVGHGARVRRAIIGADNEVPPFEDIGLDPVRDRRRFEVTPAGVVVVPAGYYARADGRVPAIRLAAAGAALTAFAPAAHAGSASSKAISCG